jgi:hypothetical protein
MSKNARKKAAKQAAYELKKAAKKAHEKQAKRTRGEEIRADHAAKLQAMTDVERRKYEESRAAAREIRKKEAETAKARKKAALTAPQRVVIDLEFAHLMEEKGTQINGVPTRHLLQRKRQSGGSRADTRHRTRRRHGRRGAQGVQRRGTLGGAHERRDIPRVAGAD